MDGAWAHPEGEQGERVTGGLLVPGFVGEQMVCLSEDTANYGVTAGLGRRSWGLDMFCA